MLKPHFSKTTIGIISSHIAFFLLNTLSHAVVFDHKGPGIDYCHNEKPKDYNFQNYDKTCLTLESNRLILSNPATLPDALESMKIADALDVYLCAYQAGVRTENKLGIILNSLQNKVQNNADYLLLRLEKEKDETRAIGILLIFVAYAWTAYEKACQEHGECPQNIEHILQPDVARLLVSKAEAIHDCGDRNGLLDYLLPFLPLEEGLAKQKAREEEARRKAGNQE